MAWKLTCDPWFHAVYIQQSSDREGKILKKNRKIQSKNVYVRIAYKSLRVCAYVDYICVLLYVVVYVIVNMCMTIYAPRGSFEIDSWTYV